MKKISRSILSIAMFLSLITMSISAQGPKRAAMDIIPNVEQGSVEIFARAEDGTWTKAITDKDGNITDPANPPSIEVGQGLSFKVNWSISDVLNKGLVEGDWFEFHLPSNFFKFTPSDPAELKAVDELTGKTEVIGTFEVTEEAGATPSSLKITLNKTAVEKAHISNGYVSVIGFARAEKVPDEEIKIEGVILPPLEILPPNPDREFDDRDTINKDGWQISNKDLITWGFNINYDVVKKVYNGELTNPEVKHNLILVDELPLGVEQGPDSNIDIAFPIYAATSSGRMSTTLVENGWNNISLNKFTILTGAPNETWEQFQDRVEGMSVITAGLFIDPVDSRTKLIFNFKDLAGTINSPATLSEIHNLIDADANLSADQKVHTKTAYDRIFANSKNTGVLGITLQIQGLTVTGGSKDYKNEATLKWNANDSSSSSNIVKFQEIGGGATTGDPQSVTIKKLETSSEKSLAGAKFKLQVLNTSGVYEDFQPKDNPEVERSTNEKGEVVFAKLPNGKYKVVETQAPIGYQDTIKFLNDIDSFEINGSETDTIYITAYNFPKLIDINGTKTWNDGNNQDGIRPDTITVILKADGVEVKRLDVTEADSWKYSFTDLPEYKDGQKINYTVEEVKITGYDPVITGHDIENKHIPSTIEVNGIKTWNDGNNQDGIRPDKITVNLMVNDTVVASKVVTEAEQWKYSFTNLPEYKDGQKINYTIEEVKITGYDSVITGYDIENKHIPSTIEVNGIKTWNDGNDQDGIRPDKITVILKADGVEVKRLDVTEADSWKYGFTDLPKNKNGQKINYTIEEVKITGYDPVITGYDIENKHIPYTTEISGTKTWNDGNDQDGLRPGKITVVLKANDVEVKRLDVTESDSWKYSFTNLPVNQNGQLITYTVEEVVVPGYETNITGYDIENKHVPGSIEISGTKTWNDGNDQDGFRPDSITVILKADGVEVKRLDVTEADSWKYSFTNLPELSDGKVIKYTVEEIAIPAYETVVNGYDIENKHTPSITEIGGTKAWNDGNNQDGLRPDSITVILKANGVEVKRIDVTEADSWKYSFTDLPEFKDGKKISFTVEEVAVPGYESIITGYNIENKHVPGSIEISGTKTWDDGNDQDGLRPDSITVVLKADGVEVKRLDVTEADGWKYSFTNLPELNDGKKVSYTIEELEVTGYESSVTEYDIHNTHIPEEIDITGKKIWIDNNNINSSRPKSITIRLFADGIEVENVNPEWTKENSEWTYVYTNLPRFENGKEIKYTVTEDKVQDYSTKIDGFTITNIFEEPPGPELPKTGKGSNYQPFILIGLGLVISTVSYNRNNNKKKREMNSL